MSEAQKRASRKYDQTHTTGLYLKLNLKTDEDIIIHLDTKTNVQGYIKDLIRKDIEEDKQERKRNKQKPKFA